MLTEPIPYFKTLPKRALFWWTHENLANFCKINTIKIWHVVKDSFRNLPNCKNLIRNLTRREKFDSESDKTKNFYFKRMLFTKLFSLKIMLFRRRFTLKVMLFRQNLATNSCFLNLHVNRKVCTFYGVNWIETWFFASKVFLKNCFL